jgi:class 3 adenylate cyclase
VLAAASLAAERTAAYLRLGTLILIGLGLVGLGFLAGVYRDWIAAIFARYLPSGLLPLLAEADVEALKRGRRQDAGILFADISGFTAMTESLGPRGPSPSS